MGISITRLLAASVSVAPFLILGAAHAQAQSAAPTPDATLEEVVVTATKTGAQRLQRTPDAISAVSGEQLAAQGVKNIKDLAQFVPNVTFAQNTASAAIYIRGIGSNNVSAGSDPDVTMQVDGVYIARPSGQFADFLDVQSVEVLRGPQGTLYGRNAVGGTINVISRTPSSTFGGKAEINAGNFGLVQGGLYLTGPLVGDKLTGSIALNYINHSAYFENITPGGHDVGEANRGGVKAQLRWQPTDIFSATTRFDVGRGDEYFETYTHLIAPTRSAPLANTVVGDFRKVAVNTPQKLLTQYGGISEDISWRLLDHFTLKSITAWRTNKYRFTNDNDATELQIQASRQQETDTQFSQEFNLQYVGEKLKAVGGVYYFEDTDLQNNSVIVPPSPDTPAARAIQNQVSPDVRSRSAAVFAQGTYSFTPELSVVLGGRYTSETKSLDQLYTRTSLNPATPGAFLPSFPSAFKLSNDYSAFTPKFGLNWQATPDALLYASVTRGYKSGGFNFSASTASTAAFQPEKIWSYEAGAKTEWLDRRLRVNLSGFVYDYTNLQVQQLISAGVFSIGNAATAEVKGVELEVVAKPTASLQLSANFSALDAKYKNYTGASVPAALAPYIQNQTCVGTTCTVDVSGKYLTGAPKTSGMVAADYSHELGGGFGLNAHLDYTWRDRTYFDPSNVWVMSQGAYGLVNAQIGVTSPDRAWTVQVWGKNLGDKGYYVTTAASGVAPDGAVGDPRTYGVRVTRSW